MFILEAFAWRAHSSTKRLVELITKGAVGEVKVIDATFGLNLYGQPNNIRMINALSGGSIMDVGCYPVSMAQLVVGAAIGRNVFEPIEIHASGHVGQTGVDEWAADGRFRLVIENNDPKMALARATNLSIATRWMYWAHA